MNTDTRREQLYEIIKKEFIGPDPIDLPGMIQENGEEILSADPPRIRYAAGILYPQKVKPEVREQIEETAELMNEEYENDVDTESEIKKESGRTEFLEDAEELINLSNSYQQSAISVTAAIKIGDKLKVKVEAGRYDSHRYKDSESGFESTKYFRHQLIWNNDTDFLLLPDIGSGIKKIDIRDKESETGLRFNIVYRYKADNYKIYTFTLENKKEIGEKGLKDDDCFFQVGFELTSETGFQPLPDSDRVSKDDDYSSNQLLYRNVKSYATGHGCAADWVEKNNAVKKIKTEIFPTYEIKPVVPSRIKDVSLEMYKMSDYGDFNATLKELKLLCDKYSEWIDGLNNKLKTLEIKYQDIAERHINNCKTCLRRMYEGVKTLQNNKTARKAFQYMNRAMLLQQLHYNLPLQNWTVNEDSELVLEQPVEQLPDINDPATWYYDGKNRVYGKWRPFQLAFILMNINSMTNKTCEDREKVDLIWFPTGGGKTEAYLGLSAYTIFIRRLNDKDDTGTTILMRYTLRLLTAQQYERAAAMICACELMRRNNSELLGEEEISIGLWVGGETTPNNMNDAVKKYEKLYSGKSEINPFIILKCPWCGAQMGMVQKKGARRELPGYKKVIGRNRKKRIIFQCRNSMHKCEFSGPGNELPLYIVDDDIYENTPTLLLGTVDKFAMLPYRPKAQMLFGIHNGIRKTAPDLIIQDELHLISGPLGSMVGHYETMIYELCKTIKDTSEISPKIIASTATISKAKEQCHALYGCKKENVMQFPPSGIDAGDSFFAHEDTTKAGRKYVGIMASGASSIATATIRLYASLLYAAKSIEVSSEQLRDPYWTNIGYFNSIRELGQTATWIRADINEYLHIIYKRRYEDKQKGYSNRRYIWRDEELTSRIRSDRIPFSLQNLSIKYPSEEGEKRPVDICLATNMISVGVDIPRLGLMTVSGQPKTTSEYIQATSRIGRDSSAPGIVFTIYNPGRPRDKSHYEQFKSYHSRIYCYVEPTSVTPFSAPLRDRALHAIIIGLLRLNNNMEYNESPKAKPYTEEINKIKKVISARIKAVDPEEMEFTLKQIDIIIENWHNWEPEKYHDFTAGEELPLMFPAGTMRNVAWGEQRGFPTPTSMRSVDASCEAHVLENKYTPEED